MIFTKNQIEELLKVIDAHTRYLLGLNLGYESLTNTDIETLNKFGIDIDSLKVDWPPYLQAYMFGRLAAILSDNQINQLDYTDFKSYLKKQQFVPLSPREKAEYEIARDKTYSHIVDMGDKMKSDMKNIIYNEDQATRIDQEKVIKEEMKKGVLNRKQLKTIVSDLGRRMGTWSVDWGRIVDTEMQDIYNRGVAQNIKERFGSDQKVYKDTFAGACRYCIKLHLTGGVGSEPILFTLDELYANGSNIGKKKENWLATIGPEHPFCRCQIRYVLPGQEWDNSKNEFITTRSQENIERKSKVKVQVGSKSFLI
jgi:polyhydroxyalkanoate synthesis regulator phasin